MNLLKKYFLLAAKHPVAYVFWVVIIIYTLIRLGVGVFYTPSDSIKKETLETAKNILLFASIMIFIVVAWINDSTIRAKITVLKLKSHEMVILTYPGKRIEIYDGPIWGKPFISVIRFPEKWNWKVKEGDVTEIEVPIRIKVNDVIQVMVPILIKFTFSGPFVLEDLERVLQANFYACQNNMIFSIQKQIKKVVFNLNNGVNHDLISEDALKYLTADVTEEQLISDISARIKFPDKLFINIKKTDIEISLPKFSFEKEWND